MRETEQEPQGVAVSVVWEDRPPPDGDAIREQAKVYARMFIRALHSAGYEPRRVEVGLRHGVEDALEMHVRGEASGMPEADFVALAELTFRSPRVRELFAGSPHADLTAGIGANGAAARTAAPAPAPRRADGSRSLPLGKILVGLVVVALLGIIGLLRIQPALEPTRTSPPPDVIARPTELTQQQEESAPAQAVPAAPTPRPISVVPTQASAVQGVLFSESLANPLPNWPNEPDGTARFSNGAYRLFAREPGRFVAVGIPLSQPVGDVVLTGDFHKLGGPPGGGYGFIVRDQGTTRERDGHNQGGAYIALAVNDRGDIGVWQRDETRWIDLVPWTHSAAVRSGTETNTLVVATRDLGIRFDVNGQTVADLSYNLVPASGGVGIFVGGDLNEVSLDRLRIEGT